MNFRIIKSILTKWILQMFGLISPFRQRGTYFFPIFFILQKRSYDTEFGTIYLRPEQVSQPKPTFTSFSCNFQVIRKNINSDLVDK